MTSLEHYRRAFRCPTAALAAAVLAGSLLTACTSEDVPTQANQTKRPTLAACQPYGVGSAPVALTLPGMVLKETRPLPSRKGTAPRLAVMAVNELGPQRTATASASLFDGPASTGPDPIRNGIYLANMEDSRSWGVNSVVKGGITLSRASTTAQATDVSHSTFTSDLGKQPVAFDYWAFTANGHRYLLGYARFPAAKTPDAATFFATATSCPKQAK